MQIGKFIFKLVEKLLSEKEYEFTLSLSDDLEYIKALLRVFIMQLIGLINIKQ